MTLLAALVETSQRVAETSGRRAKIGEMAQFLRALQPVEIDIGVAFLAGETRQGRRGIGSALLRDARAAARAGVAAWTLVEVDTALEEILQASGHGSVAERTGRLASLFARATRREQDFQVRLL